MDPLKACRVLTIGVNPIRHGTWQAAIYKSLCRWYLGTESAFDNCSFCKHHTGIKREEVGIHPPALENFDCSKKGGVHRPRSYVVFAMEARVEQKNLERKDQR